MGCPSLSGSPHTGPFLVLFPCLVMIWSLGLWQESLEGHLLQRGWIHFLILSRQETLFAIPNATLLIPTLVSTDFNHSVSGSPMSTSFCPHLLGGCLTYKCYKHLSSKWADYDRWMDEDWVMSYGHLCAV